MLRPLCIALADRYVNREFSLFPINHRVLLFSSHFYLILALFNSSLLSPFPFISKPSKVYFIRFCSQPFWIPREISAHPSLLYNNLYIFKHFCTAALPYPSVPILLYPSPALPYYVHILALSSPAFYILAIFVHQPFLNQPSAPLHAHYLLQRFFFLHSSHTIEIGRGGSWREGRGGGRGGEGAMFFNFPALVHLFSL